MIRHFLQLYLLIVVTLAAVSWGQERLWEAYSEKTSTGAIAERQAQEAALAIVEEQLRLVPQEGRQEFVTRLAGRTGVDLELFEPRDIAGNDAFTVLAGGGVAHLRAAEKEWLLKRLPDEERVLAFRYAAPDGKRGLLDWTLAFVFYAAIALVIMAWLWPLTRDLRRLERSTTSFGNRNWTFDAHIGVRSPVHALAESFRRMATRIDGLVGAQKDLSNALSHEIRTPLARMRFELEMARSVQDPGTLSRHLNNINTDIAELDAFVTATLDYAILERAEIALNVAEHDFTLILPAIVESIKRDSRADLAFQCEVASSATRVTCDVHLMETVVRNLVYNATRYARQQIAVAFIVHPNGFYNLHVDDDGPGIAPVDRERVFSSFVRLDEPGRRKRGYGLGLAIVKRIMEWHGGTVSVSESRLGGAGFSASWPPRSRGTAPERTGKSVRAGV